MARTAFRALVLAAMLTACVAPAPTSRPAITVISPPDGTRYAIGEAIALNVAAASSNDVARVELRVGNAVLSQANEPPSPTFSARMAYTPTRMGVHTFTLFAIDKDGLLSDPLIWTGIVAEQVSVLTSPTPPPTASPAVAAPACRLDSAYVADVTIPDGTAVRAGSTFTKTWRLRNTSDCAWGAGYQLAFVDRAQMSAPDAVPVSPTAQGATVDVSVRFTGPADRNTYTSTWQLRAPGGSLFGQRIFVQVRVP